MSSKEYILNKLKNISAKEKSTTLSPIVDADFFSDYPTKNSLFKLFKKRFEDLNGELYLVKNNIEAGERLSSILLTIDNKKYVTFASGIIEDILHSVKDLQKHFDILDDIYLKSEKFADYSAGLTTADFLVARTGSIVLNSLTHGGRRLSVLPPVHIVVAETSQIVLSLEDIFKNEFLTQNWSYATIISGPSRTSDIEKQLVLGAHGPKRLIVILVENI